MPGLPPTLHPAPAQANRLHRLHRGKREERYKALCLEPTHCPCYNILLTKASYKARPDSKGRENRCHLLMGVIAGSYCKRACMQVTSEGSWAGSTICSRICFCFPNHILLCGVFFENLRKNSQKVENQTSPLDFLTQALNRIS